MDEKRKNLQGSEPKFVGMTIAWLVALVSTLGALFIGEVIGQMPCVTCWYQRIAMFPIVVILGIALLRDDENAWVYAFALALLGGVIALWHSLHYAEVLPKPIVPCTDTGPSCAGAEQLLFDTVPIPYLSLIAFTLITIALLPNLTRKAAK